MLFNIHTWRWRTTQ